MKTNEQQIDTVLEKRFAIDFDRLIRVIDDAVWWANDRYVVRKPRESVASWFMRFVAQREDASEDEIDIVIHAMGGILGPHKVEIGTVIIQPRVGRSDHLVRIYSAIRAVVSPNKTSDFQQAMRDIADWITREIDGEQQSSQPPANQVLPKAPHRNLTRLQQKIFEAVQELREHEDYLDPSDELVASRLGRNRRGEDYSRETVNRERSKMRKLKIDV